MAKHRRTALILVAVAADILLGLLSVLFGVAKLNRYRPELISYLQKKTGLQVEISRLTLTLFPSLSIRVDGFGLKNPPIFPDGYVVKAPRIDGAIDAGVLLHRQIVTKQGFFTNLVARLYGASMKNGRLFFPFRVSGTMDSPAFSLQKNDH